jgi:hypothetical protein
VLKRGRANVGKTQKKNLLNRVDFFYKFSIIFRLTWSQDSQYTP